MILAFIFPLSAFSQENDNEAPDRENIRTILMLLAAQAESTWKELEELSRLPESKRVQEKKEELLLRLDGINHNFENIATQLQTDELILNKEEKGDWVSQIQSLTLPLLDALSDLTAKPRKIERLKSQIEKLKEQKTRFEEAHQNIRSLLALSAPGNGAETEAQLEKYQERLDKLERKYNPRLVELKLEEAERALQVETQDSQSLMDSATKSIRKFFKTRGLNLLITIGIFAALWWVLMRFRSVLSKRGNLFNIPSWMNKVLMTVYSILVLLICIISSMVTLYILNDWLLLSIVILFILAVAWASRQLIPRLFKEVRLAMNLGTVKEDERLVWNGVPWLVDNIGLQATLVNERLEGGPILLPVGELVGQHSRPVVENEPWFPTQVGDWVFLSDETYGRVEHQTLEQVVLGVKGGSQKFYSTAEFLSKTPLNISNGFRYEIEFGLDYGLQSKICDEIPKLVETGLRRHLSNYFQGEDPVFPHLEIAFDHAGASSLNLKILIDAAGRQADQYFEMRREVQTVLVRICNENNLIIPFTQLTLNLSQEFQKLTGGRPPASPSQPS